MTTALAALVGTTLAAGCGDEAPTQPDCTDEAPTVTLTPHRPMPMVRLGDARLVEVSVVDGCGASLAGAGGTWTSSDPDVFTALGFDQGPDGSVRATGFGSGTLTVAYDGFQGTLAVSVERLPTMASSFTLLGGDSVPQPQTDLWVAGDYIYSGSQPFACGFGSAPACESLRASLMVWRIGADGVPSLVDSLRLPTPKINDVKVSADGSFAAASLEVDESTNGFVLLDLADPAAPVVTAHHTEGLESGVHNLWIERIDGTDYVFAAEEGTSSGGVHVVDMSDRSAQVEVGFYEAGSSFPHDVYVRDGLAFVSYWDAGLVILDVGDGRIGGSPSDPRELSRIELPGGNVHNAWYWPERSVVFVGEETFAPLDDSLDVGVMHIVDVSDLEAPRQIGTHAIGGTTPHNFWVDEDAQVLYAGWYERGLRALDVSGALGGPLPELGFIIPSGSAGSARVWAPQLHRGIVYLIESHGVWAVRPDF